MSKPITVATKVSPATHGTIRQKNLKTLLADKLDAIEQLTYWRGAKARALTEPARTHAGVCVLIWANHLKNLNEEILMRS